MKIFLGWLLGLIVSFFVNSLINNIFQLSSGIVFIVGFGCGIVFCSIGILIAKKL